MSRDYEKEKPSLILRKFLRQSQSSSNVPVLKRQKTFHSWHKRIDSPLVDTVKPNSFFHTHFKRFQSLVNQHNFLSLQRRYLVASRVWSDFSCNYCKRSRPWNEYMFQRKSSGSLELVVSKTRIFEQPSKASANHPQPLRDNGDAVWSNFQCRRARHGQKWVSGVPFGAYRVSLVGSSLEHGCSLRTRHRYTLFLFHF